MKETHSLKLDREPCRRLRAWEREKNVGTLRSWFSERHDGNSGADRKTRWLHVTQQSRRMLVRQPLAAAHERQ